MSLQGSRAFAQFSACALRNTSHSQPVLRRTFTQSSRMLRYGPVPKFENLSSPELESLLNNVRLKLIMPTHLSAEQRELIYKQRHAKSLTIDPVVANLGGEEFTLQPINRISEVPPTRGSLLAALDLMKAKSDWEILPRLLEGLRHAGLKLSVHLLAQIIRKASGAGRQDVILSCVRQATETGVRLDRAEVVREILWSFQDMALHSEFDAETTKKALAWSEQIFEMIELPAHAGEGLPAGEVDARSQPLSVGILLELAAARALKHLDGKDVDGKVGKYAEMMSSTSLDFGSPRDIHAQRVWVSKRLPVLYGLRAALKILDPTSEAAKKLQTASESLGKAVEDCMKAIDEDGTSSKGVFVKEYQSKFSGLL